MVSPAHLELATIVAAWHNRHPLARRITRADVLGTGVVALPFRPPQGPLATLQARLSSAWNRLTRRLRRGAAADSGPGALRRAFDEDFIPPLRPRRIAAFALRQGSATRPGPPEWPQRDVLPRASASPQAPARRFLRTAAIEVDDLRLRVLVGAGPRPQVLGPRLWSRQRVGTAAVAALGLLGAAGWLLAPASHEPPLTAVAPAASAPASPPRPGAAASGVVAMASPAAPGGPARSTAEAAAVSSAPQGAASATALHGAASAPLGPAVAPAAAASLPASAAAARAAAAGAASAPPQAAASGAASGDIRPHLSADLRATARQESSAARAARAASAPADAPDPDGKVYAVATPATRTRAGSQLRLVLMDVPTQADAGQPRVEVMQVGNNWHAVIWPFNNRAAAERARDVLAGRGIPTEVIDF